jgi:hypothetical protein
MEVIEKTIFRDDSGKNGYKVSIYDIQLDTKYPFVLIQAILGR